jgi:hypothetical protein
LSGDRYTSEIFNAEIDVASLLDALAGRSIFSRGLPKKEYLQKTEVADLLGKVVRAGKVSVVVPPAFSHEKMDSTLELCHKNGWLYYEQPRPSHATLDYIFSSPLHKRYVEWMLFGQTKSIKEKKLFEFAIVVIRKFLPQNLVEPRHLQSTIQTIPEAHFQDEFYRACCSHTKSCVVSFPEFGTKNGRIDFFIPSKKWGVELLRNGDRLLPHTKRFTDGEYGKWIRDGTMKDYIILDFRPDRPPRKDHKSKPSPFISCYDINCFFRYQEFLLCRL